MHQFVSLCIEKELISQERIECENWKNKWLGLEQIFLRFLFYDDRQYQDVIAIIWLQLLVFILYLLLYIPNP